MPQQTEHEHLVARRIFPFYYTHILAELFQLQGDNMSHDHDFLEIALILNGRGQHLSIRGELPLTPGDVYVLRPGAWHVYRNCEDLVVYNCGFDMELFQRELAWTREDALLHYLLFTGPTIQGRRGILHLHLSPESLEACRQRLEALSYSTRPGSSCNRGDQIGHLLLFLAELVRHLGPEHYPAAESLPRLHPAVARGVQLLEEKPEYPWSLQELSQKVHIHPAYLVRLFKSATGLPPMAYLTRMRTERAAALLLRTSRPIADIGREVGWDDANYFARRFKAAFGLSASEYRHRFVKRQSAS